MAASLILNVVLALVVGAMVARPLLHHTRGTGESSNASLPEEGPAPSEVTITIDPAADVHLISPLIYGIAKREDPNFVAEMGGTLNRWGGNSSSRFNWVIGHAWNTAADYQFINTDRDSGEGSASDRYVEGNRAVSVTSLLTIPAVGWVAKSGDPNDRSQNVPEDGGPAIAADGRIAGYDPADNRKRTSVPSQARKPGPFVLNPTANSPVVYQNEWVNHLVQTFGPAANGGVRFYAIDNEPELWSQTHRDVHPARMGYDDLARVYLDYATAVKEVDPTAKVIGPESWGWVAYNYSELDRGTDRFATHADRKAHGDVPFLPWFLRTVRAHDEKAGARSLDVLSVHFYPPAHGVYSDDSDPKVDALRLRSTRALWDPSYQDESWIKDSVHLFPRLREWVDANYPGTRIGLTEYNFGGGNSVSAALAEAEVLGILGREDVEMASYWRDPEKESPTWFAFRMFRNVDGKGAKFGDVSMRATSSAPDAVSAFAARNGNVIDVMLVNKRLRDAEKVTINLPGARSGIKAHRFEYSGADKKHIIQRPDFELGNGTLRLDLPAASITHLQMPVMS